MTSPSPAPHEHLEYARRVIEGEIPAGELLELACKRCLGDHARYGTEGEWEFRPEYAEPVIRFLEALPHVKGKWARSKQLLELQPWQRWFVAEVYGWRLREDHAVRRFVEVLLEIGRKNGKTFLAAGLALYELRYGDAGAEVYSAATKRDQAALCWNVAKAMFRHLPAKVRRDMKATVHEISWDRGLATFKPLARDSHTLDGLNPNFALVDEAAAIADREVIEALLTALGSRDGGWMLYITTAQASMSTSYREKRDALEARLRSGDRAMLEQMFGVIYALDPPSNPEKPETGDDPDDESCWPKANPNLGVSLSARSIRKAVLDSQAIPEQRRNVKIKHFNLWSGHVNAWFDDPGLWRRAAVPELTRRGQCFIGADLAQTLNLTSVCRLWVVGRGRFEADFMNWMPEATLAKVPKIWLPRYERAVELGELKLTPGQTTDYAEIDRYVRASYDAYQVDKIGADPYNANMLVNAWEEDLLPVMLVRQGLAHMNGPSKMVETLVVGGKIAHEGGPFVSWQLENCILYGPDANNNIKIRRSDSEPWRQIDAITALIIAAACTDVTADPESGVRFTYRRHGDGTTQGGLVGGIGQVPTVH